MAAGKNSFFESVYEVVRQIPAGRVTSYVAIARFLGSGKSAQMVGWAMNASFAVDPPVPAQRVVNASGILSGKFHFGPGDEMKNLLEEHLLWATTQYLRNKKLFATYECQ
jgi:methylated-DNA-protein-cysteine methyltransferase-like protein